MTEKGADPPPATPTPPPIAPTAPSVPPFPAAPPSGGSGVPPPPLSKQKLPDENDKSDPADDLRTEARARRIIGWVAGAVGVVWVGIFLAVAFYAIGTDESKPAPTGDALVYRLVALALHAVVSVAAVYFGYALLRVAERMFIPRRLFWGDAKDVEVIRAILGVDGPAKAGMDQAKALVEQAKVLTDGATGVIRSLRGDGKGEEKKDSKKEEK